MRYCSACRSNVRRNHLSTKRHRLATRERSPNGRRKYRPVAAWRIGLRGDYEGTPEENAAAWARLQAMA